MAKKLYLVRLSMETLVYAEDEQAAMSVAEMEANDFYLAAEFPTEMRLNEEGKLPLPEGWDPTSIPLGAYDDEDGEDELTVGQIEEEMRDEAALAKNLELPLGTQT